MKKQRCIVQIISISRRGEVRHFQVRIPENTKFITGVETAVRVRGDIALPRHAFSIPEAGLSPELFSALPNPKPLAGELKLQSCEEANVFYATNITDPSVSETLSKIPIPSAITENIWTHGYKRGLEEVLVDGNTTLLSGLYRDKLGIFQDQDISYDVFLYVWYKLKATEDDTNKQLKEKTI